jgi:hypothetical protein
MIRTEERPLIPLSKRETWGCENEQAFCTGSEKQGAGFIRQL